MSRPTPDPKEFPLSDREKCMWYMFTMYLPPTSMYHRDDLVFKLFRQQQCPDMSKEEFQKLVRDCAIMEKNYLKQANTQFDKVAKKPKEGETLMFCPTCEKQTIHAQKICLTCDNVNDPDKMN